MTAKNLLAAAVSNPELTNIVRDTVVNEVAATDPTVSANERKSASRKVTRAKAAVANVTKANAKAAKVAKSTKPTRAAKRAAKSANPFAGMTRAERRKADPVYAAKVADWRLARRNRMKAWRTVGRDLTAMVDAGDVAGFDTAIAALRKQVVKNQPKPMATKAAKSAK